MNTDTGGSAVRRPASGLPDQGRASHHGRRETLARRGLTSPPLTACRARLLAWVAVAGIGGGPPWGLSPVHVSLTTATVAPWAAVIGGTAGVIAGLAAISRGARPSIRWLLAAAAVTVAVLTVLPSAGSTDAFDYATYGRILLLGHNPYVMTPYHLRPLHGPFAASVPVTWQHLGSVYGPLATLEQYAAARLGGTSAARVTFGLKLWNSIAFGVVALPADGLPRGKPARRLRAHLLWTVNPLLLWDVVAAGYLDVLADRPGGRHQGQLCPVRPGGAWALRRWPTAVAAAACAALAVLAPGYAWFGLPALRPLERLRPEYRCMRSCRVPSELGPTLSRPDKNSCHAHLEGIAA